MQAGGCLRGDVGRVIPLRGLLLELGEFGLIGPALLLGLTQRASRGEVAGYGGRQYHDEQDEDRPGAERASGDAAAPAASTRAGTSGRRIRHQPDPALASNRGKAPAPAERAARSEEHTSE